MAEDREAATGRGDQEQRAEDSYVGQARNALRELFESDRTRVFYLKQLEVKFEKQFFHWVTARATNQLLEEGLLRAEEAPLGPGTRVKFVFHKGNRYYRRQMRRSLEVVQEYSQPKIAGACGEQADMLFLNALASRGFVCVGQDINEYEGKTWNRTRHDLDFIMERNGRAYGCEVKNTWDYIDREEMRVKLDICKFLGLVPLFIMRHSPKSYNEEIRKRGGMFIIFVSHIYPFGQEALVQRIEDVLGLPADCPRAIPSGIVDRFVRLHERSVQ